jgi:hypothetical protein
MKTVKRSKPVKPVVTRTVDEVKEQQPEPAPKPPMLVPNLNRINADVAEGELSYFIRYGTIPVFEVNVVFQLVLLMRPSMHCPV